MPAAASEPPRRENVRIYKETAVSSRQRGSIRHPSPRHETEQGLPLPVPVNNRVQCDFLQILGAGDLEDDRRKHGEETIDKEVRSHGFTLHEAPKMAADRAGWKSYLLP
ncbi:hypothetical protein Bbelb_096420 [Branchiostoma belcheri]|nr:hypothetical protein Bbelb_096420 [Branchiostoma belcheri]